MESWSPPITGARRNGHASVEIALMAPWIFLLFIAVFDFGFYAYAASCTQNAARVAALSTAADVSTASSQTIGCAQALAELRMLPNVAALPANYSCSGPPLTVTVNSLADTENPSKQFSRVAVTYRTVQLFPLPYLMGQMTMTRIADMRVYGD